MLRGFLSVFLLVVLVSGCQHVVTVLPQPLQQNLPSYPAAMRQKNIEGDVLLEFTVDATGAVRAPRVIAASRPEFEHPALIAVAKWRYVPGSVGGKPTDMQVSVPMSFRLGDGQPSIDPSLRAEADTAVKFRNRTAQASTE